jgi:phosphoribosylformylglycinamidine (FGAM) synthase PurS component
LFVDSNDEKSAGEAVEKACTKLLCNQIMESFKFTLEEA